MTRKFPTSSDSQDRQARRQIRVGTLALEGLTAAEIAKAVGSSRRTVYEDLDSMGFGEGRRAQCPGTRRTPIARQGDTGICARCGEPVGVRSDGTARAHQLKAEA